ncbi:NAD-dependent epimerase/dehydratase family protein [Streptomyces sp. NPDC059010]|uniref:NAD-dependent epimerase/dehydratase family protein n=1 Tax=Streptomyces sp. NPDC059010 TaxID=3346695 RepID=UPI0036B14244
MKVIVTGGAGFIGSHVVDALCRARCDVVVIDDFSTGRRENLAPAVARHPELRVVEADIRSPEAAAAVEEFAPEVLVHFAAQMSVKVSMRDPRLDASVNVLGLLNLLEAARRSGCRKVVFASSGGTVYGAPGPDAAPRDETDPRVPQSFYGLTKSVSVDYLRLYREQYGTEYAALALGNVYGPRQDPYGEAGVVAIFAGRMLGGLPCVVNGDGLTTRDFVHVDDVVRAVTAALRSGHGLINIGTGTPTSVLDVHAAVALAVGSDGRPEFGPALTGEVRHVSLRVDRAERELGWRARVGLDEGVATVVDWMCDARSRGLGAVA